MLWLNWPVRLGVVSALQLCYRFCSQLWAKIDSSREGLKYVTLTPFQRILTFPKWIHFHFRSEFSPSSAPNEALGWLFLCTAFYDRIPGLSGCLYIYFPSDPVHNFSEAFQYQVGMIHLKAVREMLRTAALDKAKPISSCRFGHGCRVAGPGKLPCPAWCCWQPCCFTTNWFMYLGTSHLTSRASVSSSVK